MSDLIRCLQEVKSLAADPSVPARQRLAQASRSFAALDLTGFGEERREQFEADLAHLKDTLVHLRSETEGGARTDEEKYQELLDSVQDVASQAIDAELDRIMEELNAGVGKLPEDAIREVRQHADLMVPRLIDVLQEATAAAREGMTPKGNSHFFALFLVTELRAEEAFPAIVEAFSLPGELPEELFGDAVTSTFARVLALFDGQRLEVIDALIDNRDLNEYVRWEAAQSYVHMVRDGRLHRDEAVERLRRHLRTAIDEKDEDIASGVVCELLPFGPKEAIEDIKEAYELGLVDPTLVSLEDAEQSIADGEAGMLKELERCPPTGIEDTIAELRQWYAFREKPARPVVPEAQPLPPPPRPLPPRPLPAAGAPAGLAAERVHSRGVRVGRNEPCPCGSGKKFKKCCLGRK
ncbi:MAG: DUF1186 domain-containing protein [Pirellulales bacterium]